MRDWAFAQWLSYFEKPGVTVPSNTSRTLPGSRHSILSRPIGPGEGVGGTPLARPLSTSLCEVFQWGKCA